jgi:hypothetical protein
VVNFYFGKVVKYYIGSNTIADDYSHECVEIGVDYGIGGVYVTRLLDRAALFRDIEQ